MATANIDTNGRCGFCWQVFKDMVDPRMLTCGHIHCKSCLTSAMEGYKVVELACPYCKEVIKQSDVDGLEKVPQSDVNGDKVTLTCDSEKCDKKTAVSFCVDCNMKVCDTHQQFHGEMFGSRHKVISIKEYQESPGKYKKTFCEHHRKEMLIKACNQCYKLICKECDRVEGDCKAPNSQHEYGELAEVSEKITSQFKELSRSADNMRYQLFNMEKDSWKKLDQINEECQKWLKEVERVRDEQIRLINEESERVKEKIQTYLQESIEEVETFCAGVLAAKENLDVPRDQVHQLMGEGSLADKVKQLSKMAEMLTKSLNVITVVCEPGKDVTLHVKAEPTNFNAKFIDLPSSLTLTSEHDTGGGCASATHRANGDVLVAGGGGLNVFSEETRQLAKRDIPHQRVSTVIEHHQVVYVLYLDVESKKWRVAICLPDFSHFNKLFEFVNSNTTPFMTVSDQYIVLWYRQEEPVTLNLMIYNNRTENFEAELDAGILPPYLLPDSALLGPGADQLTKYNINDGQLTPIWTCKELTNIWTVCADVNGLIYASTLSNQQSIYIISSDGKKLKELHHDKLPAVPGLMSVKEDELVVPGWDDKKLYIFKLNY